MTLPTIQSLWIGNPLTNVERLCVQSFLDHGHEFHLYVYDHIGGVPDGAMVKDGNEILPASDIFRYQGGSVAGFADWFRYALLAKYGGFWVDMDMVCIRPFNFDNALVLTSGGSDSLCTNSVIGAPPGHPLLLAMAKFCREYKNKEGSKWGAVGGPQVLGKFVEELNLEKHIKPFPCFVPLASSQWMTVFDQTFSDSIDLYPQTHSVHLFNEMLRKQNGFDKNARFDGQSMFEQLKVRHHITPPPPRIRVA